MTALQLVGDTPEFKSPPSGSVVAFPTGTLITAPSLAPDFTEAQRHGEALTDAAGTALCFRLINPGSGEVIELNGPLAEAWPQITKAQANGYNVYFVVSAGGRTDAEISHVRALFIDGDGISVPDLFHAEPDILLQRDATHWHSYWRVSDLPVGSFKEAQHRLAADYGSDKSICNPSRIMRLAGTVHYRNGVASPGYRITAVRSGPMRSAAEAMEGVRELPQSDSKEPSAALGEPVTVAMLRAMLAHIEPTFADDQSTWLGIAKAVRHRQSPVVGEYDGADLVDEWCSGALWRERMRDTKFTVSTYRGREELLHRLEGSARETGSQIGLGSIIELANAGGYTGPKEIRALSAQLVENAKSHFTQPASRLRIVSSKELRDMHIKPREMALAPVLPMSGLVELYAWRGLGKTYLSMAIGLAIATGGKVFNRWSAPKPRGVLIVDGEMPAKLLQDRLAELVKGAGGVWPEDGFLGFISSDLMPEGMPSITKPEVQEMINEAMQSYDVLILDNLSTLAGCLREKEGDDWHPLQEWLLSLRRAGKCVMFVHHAGKSGEQRGNSKREDVLDTVIALRRPKDYDPVQGADVEVHLEKARGITGQDTAPFRATLIAAAGGGLTWGTSELFSPQEKVALEALRIGNPIRAVAEMTGLSKSAVGRLAVRHGQGKQAPAEGGAP